ncbi:hypothetical protein SteCoe_8297 [Stentor coeruleus]|uniref:PA domain-containing protein n=1 Tax=Stentor coeruleus TaxID=5963 RepID=A0A1R2CKI7_9CILI|nr:hypothetical protein SteCoe_8297 [Stentor coeruleus]
MLFLLMLYLALSDLTIISPDDLRNTPLTTSVSTYGSPSLLPRVGVLQIQKLDANCDFDKIFNEFDFLVIPSSTQCNQDLIIGNAARKNASMIIFLVENNQLANVHTSESNHKDLKATVIHVSKSLEKSIKSIHKYPVWAKYEYPITILEDIYITYYFTHNYTIDKYFIKDILNLDKRLIKFSPMFSYINISLVTDQENDCYTYRNNYVEYCHKPGNNGTILIENGFYISRFLQEINDVWVFLDTLLDIYEDCEFDYSRGCLEKKVKVGKDIEPDISKWIEQSSIIPYYEINLKPFYWPSALKEAYCIGRNEIPNNCGLCMDDCYYNYLSKGIKGCRNCNSSSCGYVNLKCLEEEAVYGQNCYKFMLSDGSCNKGCRNDPDCANDNDKNISLLIGVEVILPSMAFFSIMWISFRIYIKKQKNPNNDDQNRCQSQDSPIPPVPPVSVEHFKKLSEYRDNSNYAGVSSFCINCNQEIQDDEQVKFENRLNVKRFIHAQQCYGN